MISSLNYIDFICSDDIMKPIISEVSDIIDIPINYLIADPERSGPKEEYAIQTFEHGQADIGRI